MRPIDPFNSNMKLLEKVLDLRAANQNIIATNIANADTPGYARKVFEFEGQLQKALKAGPETLTTTNNRHIPIAPSNISGITGKISQVRDTTGLGDENSVGLDGEMIALSKNELLYETAAQLLKKKFALLSYIVQGGK